MKEELADIAVCDGESRNKGPLRYVAVGASAGGLEALDSFFSAVKPDSGMAYMVVQHLSPDYKSLMVELLQKRTEMLVLRAEEGMLVEKDHLYLIPPNQEMTIFHGKLLLKEMRHDRGINLPIDIFFRSLAEDQRELAVGIILSGTGSDGVRGIRAIKETGGLILVQSEESARFDGMPRAAAQTGLADFILPPEEMPELLLRMLDYATTGNEALSMRLGNDQEGLLRIYSLLREHCKLDFSHYKPNTIIRRIERRMTVNQMSSLREYIGLLSEYPDEVRRLYRELLIGVTSFFRDAEVFDALRTVHIPAMVDRADDCIRVWVAGCSTGEEAYSLAILIHDCMEQRKRKCAVKIFATDVDRDAIVFAGNGVYPESAAADIPPRFLAKYFVHTDGHYHINRTIRQMVVFAQHNIINDPPFTNTQLISCRNMLIYLQPVLQQKVMSHFNFSLVKGGILVLGTSETTGVMGPLFSVANQKLKIYISRGEKQTGAFRAELHPLNSPSSPATGRGLIRHKVMEQTERRMLEQALDLVVAENNALAVIVNRELEVLHLSGDPNPYLEWRSGRPLNDLSKMVVRDLSIPISTGVHKLLVGREPIVYTNICVRRGDEVKTVRIRMSLLKRGQSQEPLGMLIFDEMQPPVSLQTPHQEFDYDVEAQSRIADLEQELQLSRENLQATIEELETSNEELQASNEELLASNEELQSTNEELQSVNEELYTVNAEYHSKIVDLTEMTNDLNNLMAATGIPTLFLDENLDVRKYTPELSQIFYILPSDIGRPIEHINHRLLNFVPPTMMQWEEAQNKPITREVQTQDGEYFLMHIHPYAIGQSMTSGFVITFMDIGSLKKSEQKLARAVLLLNGVQHIAGMGGWEWNLETQEMFWTDEVFHIHGLDPAQIDTDAFSHAEESLKCYNEADRNKIKEAFLRCCEKGEPYDFEVPFTDVKGAHHTIRTRAVAICCDGKVVKVMGNIQLLDK